MPPMTTTPTRTPAAIWAEAFARRSLELEGGAHDLHFLIDEGYELWPTRGQEDPRQVAEDEFKRSRG